MTFAEKLKTLRKGKGMTQMQLATATNISLGVIADIESGRHDPSKASAKVLSEYFNVPVQTFILENTGITTEKKTLTTQQIIMLADIVQEVINKQGFQITQEQRAALVDYFYQQNITDAEKIKDSLSVLAALSLKSK